MLFEIACAPVFILLLYLYYKDKYEKEPCFMLIIAVLIGFYSVFYIISLDRVIEKLMVNENIWTTSFIMSSGTEESVKFILLLFLSLNNKHFNEPYDYVIYSSFISLGYAWAENIIYVFSETLGGFSTAISRAFLSVPGHFLFSVFMGYFLMKAGYKRKSRINYGFSFISSYLTHGIYNFIIIYFGDYYLLFLIPYLAILWFLAIKIINKLMYDSLFK